MDSKTNMTSRLCRIIWHAFFCEFLFWRARIACEVETEKIMKSFQIDALAPRLETTQSQFSLLPAYPVTATPKLDVNNCPYAYVLEITAKRPTLFTVCITIPKSLRKSRGMLSYQVVTRLNFPGIPRTGNRMERLRSRGMRHGHWTPL